MDCKCSEIHYVVRSFPFYTDYEEREYISIKSIGAHTYLPDTTKNMLCFATLWQKDTINILLSFSSKPQNRLCRSSDLSPTYYTFPMHNRLAPVASRSSFHKNHSSGTVRELHSYSLLIDYPFRKEGLSFLEEGSRSQMI